MTIASAEELGRQHHSATTLPSSAELRVLIQNVLGNDLQTVNRILDEQFVSPHRYIGSVLKHAGQFRGKQVRPILLLLCHRANGTSASVAACTLAAVVEMIHTATLVHDDIIDGASLRRHLETVNSAWDAETSVLLGDFLFSRAFRLSASTGDARACELIGQATDLTCAGELHQIDAREHQSRSERDYFRVVRGKTGQLFGLSCLLGARTGGASEHVQRQLQLAGLELGMAFQIADDVLDLTGEQDQTGKDSGNDLANSRFTLPLLRAWQATRSDGRSELVSLLQHGDQMALRQHPAVLQGVESAEQTAAGFVQRCIRRLQYLPASEERSLLEAIAGFSMKRQS